MLIFDKKHTNTLIRRNFDDYIKNKIRSKFPNTALDIYHLPSYSRNELQVADFVAWSINRKFNSGDDFYFKLIEDLTINKESMELWK